MILNPQEVCANNLKKLLTDKTLEKTEQAKSNHSPFLFDMMLFENKKEDKVNAGN